MRKLFVFFVLCFCALPATAQVYQLSGKVLEDPTQVPLEAVTVYLTSQKDSTVVDYTITAKDGSFSLPVRKTPNALVLKFSFVGFGVVEYKLDGVNENRDFGIIRMKEADNMLGEVVIVAEAPPIRIKSDTLEFNASSFKVRPDANVETLLKQLPGVEIDNEGKITVNGKEVNQILVNGQPFFDKDGKIALQNLPAEIINKVQVTDTKTKTEELTGQKASSNNASINLTIDPEKNKGFFGKAMAGYGTDDRYEASLMFNYFKEKRKISVLASANNINATGFSMNEIFDSMGGGRNYSTWSSDGSFSVNNIRFGGGSGITTSNLVGLNYSDEPIEDFTTSGSYFFTNSNSENANRRRVETLLPEGTFTTLSQSDTESENFSHNLNLELQYKLDSLTTVGVMPRFSVTRNQQGAKGSSETRNENGQLARDNQDDSYSEGDSQNIEVEAYLTRRFGKKGRYGTLRLNTQNNLAERDDRRISFNNFYTDTDDDGFTELTETDNRNQLELQNNTTDTYRFYAEYAEPLRDSLALKFTVAQERRQQISERSTFDADAAGFYADYNDLLSNYLKSSQYTTTPAAELAIQKKNVEVTGSFGTSIVKFDANSRYLGEQTSITKDYLLPHMNVWGNIKLSKSSSIWLNYNYDVNFPSAAQILPVEDLSNPQHTYVGNPDIDPSKNHYFYVSFRDYNFAAKSGYSFYAGGNFFDSQIVSFTTYDESRRGTTTYVNIEGSYSAWAGGNWNRTIKREAHSLRFGLGLGASVTHSKGFVEGAAFVADAVRLTPRISFNYDYGELLSIGPRYDFTYSETSYKNYLVEQVNNVTHRFTLQTTSYWPKKVVFGNDFSYTYNSNIADGFKKDFYLWNMSLGYNFLNDKLLAKVKVYDLLNQNQNATRSISPTTIVDEENTVLRRYAMFSLTYKLEKFTGAKPTRNSRRFH